MGYKTITISVDDFDKLEEHLNHIHKTERTFELVGVLEFIPKFASGEDAMAGKVAHYTVTTLWRTHPMTTGRKLT